MLRSTVLSLLFGATALALPHADSQKQPLHKRLFDKTFDYVIVGGGTAGLALANRLSANSDITVAVIEAGVHYEITNPVLSTAPAGDVFWTGANPLDSNPLVDWGFVTEPLAGALDREVHYARGKCLGGSSARNFMIYQRGTVGSYAKWADEVGDDGYTWDSLQPYFKKSVEFTPPSEKRAANGTAKYNPDAFEDGAGPLQVSYSNYAPPFSTYLQGSFNEIGLKTAEDFNSGTLEGVQYCSSTINPADERRSSSETSFLAAAKSRSNLHVFSATMAKKILFDGKKATGVKVAPLDIGLLPYSIKARKEVILSAGTFQSPQMLMVSGVGPESTLEQFGIEAVSKLEGVGQNMWDHVFFGPSYRMNMRTATSLVNDPVWLVKQYATDFLLKQEGMLTNPISDLLGWEKVPDSLRSEFPSSAQDDLNSFPEDWPEIEYLSAPGYIGNFTSLTGTQPKDGYQYGSILATLVKPLSRGNVTIKSTDTSDKPLINPNWLAHPTDQQVAIAAYKRARQVFNTTFMAPALVEKDEYFPGFDVQSDEDLLNVIRGSVMTVWHASGTSKMGKEDDPMAVIDTSCKVYGTEGLRVVDASSFPFLPPGHPQSTIYALAEKIAAEILAEL
ncbi:hypothetical protein D0864_05863 [Hortaea werneckii]|uniref:Glucose-methanol-choline oxidoreductase N-terminal domain-containing protein n=1 Tax=Hortaea werneckii TaxID=91943 RepID=A0A3M7FW31_HORWE|nr:putative choline dehydrogenase [Hortaea werneckii]RMY92561.1 hypothetical protein D0864_05863 [Hortaea werneckii]